MKQTSQITGKVFQLTFKKAIDHILPSKQSLCMITQNMPKIVAQSQVIRNMDVQTIPMQAKINTSKLANLVPSKNMMKKLVGVVTICGIGCAVYKYFYNKHCLEKDNQKKQPIINEIKQQSVVNQPNQDLVMLNQQQLDQISSLSTVAFQKQYDELICPIQQTLMKNPISLKCGHQFSKEAIAKHVQKYHNCPLKCQGKVQVSDFRPSKGLQRTIQRFRKRVIKKGKEWINQRILMDFQTQIVEHL